MEPVTTTPEKMERKKRWNKKSKKIPKDFHPYNSIERRELPSNEDGVKFDKIVSTEKIHGANVSQFIYADRVCAFTRKGNEAFIHGSNPFFAKRKWCKAFADIQQLFQEKLKLDKNCYIRVNGEYFGGSGANRVQENLTVKCNYSAQNQFRVFDISTNMQECNTYNLMQGTSHGRKIMINGKNVECADKHELFFDWNTIEKICVKVGLQTVPVLMTTTNPDCVHDWIKLTQPGG